MDYLILLILALCFLLDRIKKYTSPNMQRYINFFFFVALRARKATENLSALRFSIIDYK